MDLFFGARFYTLFNNIYAYAKNKGDFTAGSVIPQ